MSTSKDNQIDQDLANLIDEIWLKYLFFGYRKIKVFLKNQGIAINHGAVANLPH